MPFPLFLVAVCLAVTLGSTVVRALDGAGEAAVTGTAEHLLAFLDFFAGVFTLLSLTGAVVTGLAATDRTLLTPRHRVAVQSVHRAASVGAVGFLIAHISVKIVEKEAGPLVPLLPFSGGATFAVGLGVLAADLMVLTAITGVLRGRFADGKRPWLWRPMHSAAYISWPIALAHGLTAGRQAAVWVLWSYGLCAAAVGVALLVRLLGASGRSSALRRQRQALLAYRPRGVRTATRSAEAAAVPTAKTLPFPLPEESAATGRAVPIPEPAARASEDAAMQTSSAGSMAGRRPDHSEPRPGDEETAALTPADLAELDQLLAAAAPGPAARPRSHRGKPEEPRPWQPVHSGPRDAEAAREMSARSAGPEAAYPAGGQREYAAGPDAGMSSGTAAGAAATAGGRSSDAEQVPPRPAYPPAVGSAQAAQAGGFTGGLPGWAAETASMVPPRPEQQPAGIAQPFAQPPLHQAGHGGAGSAQDGPSRYGAAAGGPFGHPEPAGWSGSAEPEGWSGSAEPEGWSGSAEPEGWSGSAGWAGEAAWSAGPDLANRYGAGRSAADPAWAGQDTTGAGWAGQAGQGGQDLTGPGWAGHDSAAYGRTDPWPAGAVPTGQGWAAQGWAAQVPTGQGGPVDPGWEDDDLTDTGSWRRLTEGTPFAGTPPWGLPTVSVAEAPAAPHPYGAEHAPGAWQTAEPASGHRADAAPAAPAPAAEPAPPLVPEIDVPYWNPVPRGRHAHPFPRGAR